MTTSIFDVPFNNPNCSTSDKFIHILSICYDLASSEKSGAKYGPKAILEESNYQESYSSYQHMDLADEEKQLPFSYLGTITQNLNINEMMKEIEHVASMIPKNLVTLGGDHSISYPIIKSLYKNHPNLKVLQFDAHADLRPEYEGSKYSHASVMYNIGELIGFNNIKQFGIRSGTKFEFDLMKRYNTLLTTFNALDSFLNNDSSPLYITIDMDVFDNLTGTGTPVPGGITFHQFIEFIKMIPKNKNIIGFDIVETAPNLDPSGYSTIVATLCLKELLLKFRRN